MRKEDTDTPKSFTAEDMYTAFKEGQTEGYCRGWSEWPNDSEELIRDNFFKWMNKQSLVESLGKKKYKINLANAVI